MVHLKPGAQISWSPNSEEGWTIGFSPEHYCCIKVDFPKTRSERNVDTVNFFPVIIYYPKVDLNNYLRQAATDAITILTASPSPAAPILKAGDPTCNTLFKIAKVLQIVISY